MTGWPQINLSGDTKLHSLSVLRPVTDRADNIRILVLLADVPPVFVSSVDSHLSSDSSVFARYQRHRHPRLAAVYDNGGA